jgi:hypothetical protein
MRNDAVDDADGHQAIDRRLDPAVLVEVVPRAAPALCLAGIAGLVEDSGVDPSDGTAEDAVPVERFVPIRRELDVVCVEADVDLLELARLRIEVLDLAEAGLLRRQRG